METILQDFRQLSEIYDNLTFIQFHKYNRDFYSSRYRRYSNDPNVGVTVLLLLVSHIREIPENRRIILQTPRIETTMEIYLN